MSSKYVVAGMRTRDWRSRAVFFVLPSVWELRPAVAMLGQLVHGQVRESIQHGRNTTSRRVLASANHNTKLLNFMRNWSIRWGREIIDHDAVIDFTWSRRLDNLRARSVYNKIRCKDFLQKHLHLGHSLRSSN